MSATIFKPLRRALLGLIASSLLTGSAWAQALGSKEAVPAQIRIGFQKSAIYLVVLKQRGILEKRFRGSKVTWYEFPAGPQLLEALSVGSVDFGLTGDSPPVFAQAAGKELIYVGAEPPKPLSSAILVPGDSSIQNLADLKGKKIAVQKGSSAHFLVLQAIKKAGLKWSDIQPMYLAPAEARAAFERGSLDAWAIWDPYYAATELAIKPRVLTVGKGLTNNNSFYLAAKPFVQNHPDAVLALLDELTKADAYVHQHRKEVAQYVADLSGLSLATVHRFIDRRPLPAPTRPLTPDLVRDQQEVADSFFENGLIPRAIKISDVVWNPRPSAAPVAANNK